MLAEDIRDPYPLLLWPDPRLQLVCEPIKAQPIHEIDRLFDSMWDVLGRENGWGLAAPQLGAPVRMIICKVPKCCKIEIVNPVITKRWGGSFYSEEGCLSFPGKTVRIRRDRFCRVEGLDRWLRPVAFSGRDHNAACIQHEIDHLDGITIADHDKLPVNENPE